MFRLYALLCALRVEASSATAWCIDELGEAETVVSLLQIGPPQLHEADRQGEKMEEAFMQLAGALATTTEISISVGGFVLLAVAILACICCCSLPSQWSGKESYAEILPPVSDKNPTTARQGASSSCCCGVLSWAREKKAKESKEGDALSDPIIGFVPKPPAEHTGADGHVNFSGSWKCKEAGGELDGVFADMGIGFVARKTMAAFGWGVGTVVRRYEQLGNHVKVTERAIQETVQEFDILGVEQRVNGGDVIFLQTTFWDTVKPQVLRWKGTDLEKAQPHVWTRTCQFFLDKDHLRIECTSSSEKICWWIYERET